jgi:pimeloyl-ACP methyl ester carboxylesterase
LIERIVTTPDVELCAESFGRSGDTPAILMIMGATASMVWWPDQLLQRIAAHGRFVVRFDHRDTGRSTCWPPGETRYSVDDMAGDALAILDAFAIERAHLVGMSLGGMLAQILALRAPARVATLTLMASEIHGDPGPGVPPIDPALLAHFATAATVDWTDESSATGFQLETSRLCSRRHPFEEERILDTARREFRRARSYPSLLNHAGLGGGEASFGRTGEIAQPALVVHGTEDPVVSFQHARALVAALGRSRLLTLEGAGHELHSSDWPAIADAIVEITADALDPDPTDR